MAIAVFVMFLFQVRSLPPSQKLQFYSPLFTNASSFFSQLQLVLASETPVESHDNNYYTKQLLLQTPSRIFLNPYDLGRRENFKRFFNVGTIDGGRGTRFGYLTLFLPLSVPALGDGWIWEKKEGWENGSVKREEELTDEEDGSEDY